MDSSRLGGQFFPSSPATSPAGGSGPLDVSASNYFLVFSLRMNDEILSNFLVKNLIRECMEVYGSGKFQCWENIASFCIRVTSTTYQLDVFLAMAKETMRIWGCNPDDIVKFRSDFPQRA